MAEYPHAFRCPRCRQPIDSQTPFSIDIHVPQDSAGLDEKRHGQGRGQDDAASYANASEEHSGAGAGNAAASGPSANSNNSRFGSGVS